jgi:hypothetical protein
MQFKKFSKELTKIMKKFNFTAWKVPISTENIDANFICNETAP